MEKTNFLHNVLLQRRQTLHFYVFKKANDNVKVRQFGHI